MLSKEEYLDGVCKEIHFKVVRKYIREELEQHIEDKKREFIETGMPDAEIAAVASMGDAAETGRAFNKLHRPRTEWGVIVCMLLLSVAGVFAVYAGTTYSPYYDITSYFLGSAFQSLLLSPIAIGLCIIAGIYFADYIWLLRLRHALFGVAVLYIGSYLFLNPPLQVPYAFEGFLGQTAVIVISELFFVIGIAGYIQRNSGKSLKGAIFITVLCAVSIFAMSLLSTVYSLLLAVVYISLLGVNSYNHRSRKNWIRFAAASGTIIAVFLICLLLLPKIWFVFGTNIGTPYYSTEMVHNMLKEAKIIGAAPQYIQSQTWSLGDSTTGFILTAVIGAYGWLAGAGVILAFTALLLLLIARSLKITDSFGKLLTFSVCAFFFIRFMLFTLTNLGLIGGISVNLPFVSYGNSSYIADAVLIGIFLSVWRRSSIIKPSLIPVNLKSESLNVPN